MFEQLDLVDAQLNERPDGSLEILGRDGYIVLKAKYAEKIRASYKKFFAGFPKVESLKIAVNIELPQPMGSIVNETRDDAATRYRREQEDKQTDELNGKKHVVIPDYLDEWK
jgi:hypothetical protein